MRKRNLLLTATAFTISAFLSCNKEEIVSQGNEFPPVEESGMQPNFNGNLEIFNSDYSLYEIFSEIDYTGVEDNGSFDLAEYSVLMAVNRKNNNPVFFGCPGTDETNYKLSAKETALYFTLAAIPYVRRPYYKPYLGSIKQALYTLSEVKTLEEAIKNCIKDKGYIDYDVVGEQIGRAVDQAITELELDFSNPPAEEMSAMTRSGRAGNQAEHPTNEQPVFIPDTYAATGGYYRVSNKFPEKWTKDVYNEKTDSYTIRRNFYNSTPALIGVLTTKYSQETDIHQTSGYEYAGFLSPYYPPDLMSIKGNWENLKNTYKGTKDLFTGNFTNTDFDSKKTTLEFDVNRYDANGILFNNGYIDPEVIRGLNILYVLMDNFISVAEDISGAKAFSEDEFTNAFFKFLLKRGTKDIINYSIWFEEKRYDMIIDSAIENLEKFVMEDIMFYSMESFLAKALGKKKLSQAWKDIVGGWATVYKYSKLAYKSATWGLIMDKRKFLGTVPVKFILTIPTDALVAYYPFNGNANDESGKGNHGKVYGATLTSDRKGNAQHAYQFGGLANPNYIFVKNSSSLVFDKECTFSAFVQLNSNSSSNAVIAKSHDIRGFSINATANNENFHTHLASFARWAYINGQRHAYGLVKGNYFEKWVHLAYVFSSTGVKIYINGKLSETHNLMPDFSTANTQDVYIGKYSDQWWPLKGKIDDIRIYNRALSDEEVRALYEE